ncbi:MAG: hypothetical protein HRT99_02645 [Mycoplasmatales bacterium]|nr:hypothetical protein [Mycoplasmatales bacterium]
MYTSNNGNFKEGIIWWDTEIDFSADVDIFFFIHDFDKRAENPYGFKTLEIDLNLKEEEIRKGYKPNLRNELNQADRQKFLIEYKEKLNQKELKEYVDNYNSFAQFKGLQKTSLELISQMNNDGKMIFSFVYKEDVLIAVHSHYVGLGRSRLYQSFSTNNKFNGKINGLANKYLTNKDILYFKNKKLNIYDFGGIGNTDGDNSRFEGIIKFKKQFGGNEKILWKGTTLNGERGKKVYEKYFK